MRPGMLKDIKLDDVGQQKEPNDQRADSLIPMGRLASHEEDEADYAIVVEEPALGVEPVQLRASSPGRGCRR